MSKKIIRNMTTAEAITVVSAVTGMRAVGKVEIEDNTLYWDNMRMNSSEFSCKAIEYMRKEGAHVMLTREESDADELELDVWAYYLNGQGHKYRYKHRVAHREMVLCVFGAVLFVMNEVSSQ